MHGAHFVAFTALTWSALSLLFAALPAFPEQQKKVNFFYLGLAFAAVAGAALLWGVGR